jgi:3-carboxy-cis,cis-muconate cycloisomerase
VPSDPGSLFDPIFSTDEVLAATGPNAWLQAMLDVEAALAGVEAEMALLPADAAATIVGCCRVERFDAGELGRAARQGGNPVIPLVEALRAAVPEPAAQWVHRGATSQDILDSAAMLVARRSIVLIDGELDGLAAACAELAARHGHTVMAGRTLLQQALPVTFGVKAAGWLVGTVEARTRLGEAASLLAVQLGGAAGTLAAFGSDGPEVVRRLSARLGLAEPLLPWHTNRVRVADVASALGMVVGAAAKVALDVGLLMQTEVAEVREPHPGGSSTLPHKRNPIGAATVGAAARRAPALVSMMLGAMVQEHERALGGWQAEWQTMTELLRLAGGAAGRARETVAGLEVDVDRMGGNLRDVIMSERVVLALEPCLGRSEATRLVEQAAERTTASGRSLGEELADEPAVARALSREEIDDLVDPAGYLGASDALVERALEAYRRG